MPFPGGYRFCPVCGGHLETRARSLLLCTSCGYKFYQNAKPAVGALLTRTGGGDTELLLVRRGVEPFAGSWDVPGGFIENGEDAEAAVYREIREELDTDIRINSLLCAEADTYPRDGVPEIAGNTLCLYYLCTLENEHAGGLTARDDITEYSWFSMSSLPGDIAFQGNRRAIAKLAEGSAH